MRGEWGLMVDKGGDGRDGWKGEGSHIANNRDMVYDMVSRSVDPISFRRKLARGRRVAWGGGG